MSSTSSQLNDHSIVLRAVIEDREVGRHDTIVEGLEHGNLDADAQRSMLLYWRKGLGKEMLAFFILGITIALPTMVVTSAASSMFTGITGLWGVCLSIAAAVTTFTTPLFIHHVPYNVRVVVSFIASVFSLVICVFGSSVVGPSIGTILAGFVYAFGTSLYLSVAAFYNQRTVIAFSTGSGFSAVLGPALYIAFMQAFKKEWRHALLVFLPLTFVQPLVWWIMRSSPNCIAAEQTRKTACIQEAERFANQKAATRSGVTVPTKSSNNGTHSKTGFGPGRSRIGLFFRTIMPQYVIPLLTCTCGAMFVLSGLAPTFQDLDTFKGAPKGSLNYELNFLMYGAAQFLLAGLAIFHAFPMIWMWALAQIFIIAIGIIQLFYPFLTYYGVWLIFMFTTGGIVGGGVTNTNYKVAEDFRKRGEEDDVRAFAMSYGGLGNFAGDLMGGGLAILVEKLATDHLAMRKHGGL